MKYSILYLLLLGGLFLSKLNATTYYVNDGFLTGDVFCTVVGNNSNSGLDSLHPKLTLKNLWITYGPAGLNVLTSGDIIKIDAGVYSVTGFASVDEAKFDITVPGLTFLGAGVGKTIFDHNFHGGTTDYFMWIKANNTTVKNMTVQEFSGCPSCSGVTISGVNTGGQAFTIDNATNILLENVQTNNNGGNGNAAITVGPNSQTVIRGGGSTCNAEGAMFGGGVDVLGANINLLLENYVLAYNTKSAFFGSALYVWGNNSTTIVNVKNTRLVNNSGMEGTGLYVDGGNVNVSNCIIGNNSSVGGTYGGGVVIYNGSVRLSKTRLANNSGNKGGGVAVFPLNGAVVLTLDTCLFSGNVATSGRGVDLYLRPRNATNTFTVTARHTTFSSLGNTITYEGTNTCTGSSVTLINSGNPTVENLTTFPCNTPVLFNTNAPDSVPNPSPPSFSGICGSIIFLPVELIMFTANVLDNRVVKLQWQTASETNNQYFTIEKSKDAIHWHELERIEGSGNSNSLQTYELLDMMPDEDNYYRLKQTDYNGDEEEFNIIYVSFTNPSSSMVTFYPNPATHQLTLATYLNGDNYISFTDVSGHIIYQNIIKGAQANTIDISMIPKGLYFLHLKNQAKTEKHKLVINR